METERNLEETRIKGITPKLLVSGVLAWSTLLFSILGTYYDIKAEFKDQDKTNALIQVQIDALKVQVATLNDEVQKLSDDNATNQNTLSILKIQLEKK